MSIERFLFYSSSILCFVLTQVLGNSFDACALFTLGSSMVNRLKRITQLGVAYPMSLILSKTLLLPILCTCLHV